VDAKEPKFPLNNLAIMAKQTLITSAHISDVQVMEHHVMNGLELLIANVTVVLQTHHAVPTPAKVNKDPLTLPVKLVPPRMEHLVLIT